MVLKGEIRPIAAGVHGFDTNVALNAAQLAAAGAQGLAFAVRYLSRHAAQSC